jgi:hypothetical protein
MNIYIEIFLLKNKKSKIKLKSIKFIKQRIKAVVTSIIIILNFLKDYFSEQIDEQFKN